MEDRELRALVRDAVARYLDGQAPAGPRPAPEPLAADAPAQRSWAGHPSHVQFLTLVNVGEACLIEPSVECTHCGYCKSHGH